MATIRSSERKSGCEEFEIEKIRYGALFWRRLSAGLPR
jgi:hypothetical protein